MSFGDIRLRLVIRRHTVPDVKLVWPCAPSDDLTIAKLLGQVNEVVPLEGGEWGLEDYTVELGDGSNGASFECLHFQLVSRILKDEDQVLIRPLLSDDLKRRRRSGRHQISNGGKHLVDGIAFGRPWLHLPADRPALELPPRKRARITYGDEDDDEEDSDAGSEFYADFDSNDELEGDEEQASGSSLQEDEPVEEDLMQELQLLKQDRRDISEESSVNDDVGFGLLPMLDSMAALRMAFPSLPSFIVEQELRRQSHDVSDAYKALAQSYGPTLSFDEMMNSVLTASRPPNTPLAARFMSLGQESSAQPRAGRSLIEVVESVDDVVEEDADLNESGKVVGLGIRDADGDSEDASESGDTSDSDSESDSDSDMDASSSEAESLPEYVRSMRMLPIDPYKEDYGFPDSESDSDGISSSELSSSESESESESESGSESESEAHAGTIGNSQNHKKNSKRHSDSDSSSSDSDSDAAPVETAATRKPLTSTMAVPSNPAPPVPAPSVLAGGGLSRTQKRNARRKRNKLTRDSGNASEALGDSTPDDIMADLAARKAALLSSLGADVSQSEVGATAESTSLEPSANLPAGAANGIQEVPTNGVPTNGVPASGEAPTPSPRRLNLNTGASRRMLFGALGLKAPKTKADEEKLKKDLMKGVKPLANKRLVEEVEQPPQSDTIMEDDSWREKISYRAVECCHDGVVLSEPPFPFVQRWDPQQQYNTVRKRKRQSQSAYEVYEDDLLVYEDTPVEATLRKKIKAQKNKSAGASELANGHTHNTTGAEDLPPLPSDLTSLVALEQSNVNPGQLITWKQLSMSKATNWQPQMASFTGVILPGSDGQNINVVLAKRDREANDHAYDEHTGQRIYEKFEAPTLDDDDEDAEEDDGHRTVTWHEMMEPRLIPGSAPEGFVEIANGAEATVTEVSAKKNGNTSTGQPETQQSRDETHASADGADSALMHSAQRPHHFELPLADDGVMSAASDSLDTGRAFGARQQSHDHVDGHATHGANAAGSPGEGQEQLEAAADTVANTGSPPGKPSLGDGGETVVEATLGGLGTEKRNGRVKTTKTGATTEKQRPKETVVPSSLAENAEVGADDGDVVMEIGDSMDGQEDGVIPETLVDAAAATFNIGGMPSSSSSSSPFESLEELFLSASSRPAADALAHSLPLLTPTRANGNGDAEYEEAMRQLDNDEDDGESHNLFPNATQPAVTTKTTTPKGTSASTPTVRGSTRRQTKVKKLGTGTGGGGRFVIPEGTQVISLSSSPARTSPVASPTVTPKDSQKRGRGRPRRAEEPSSLEPYKLRLTKKRSGSFQQSEEDERSQTQRAKLRNRSGERQQ